MSDVNFRALSNLDYRRPWLNEAGESVVTIDGKNQPSELLARLTRQQWIEIDLRVHEWFHEKAPVTSWLMRHKLRYPPEGRQAELTAASLCYEEAPTELGSFEHQVKRIPLPITHHDCKDPGDCNISARMVAEAVERTLLGLDTFPDLHGLLNYPGVAEVLTPAETVMVLQERRYYGPYVVVHPQLPAEQQVLREKEWLAIEGVQEVIPSRLLTGEQFIAFQASADVIQMIIAQVPIAVQWDDGFKVLCCIVPRILPGLDGKVGVAVRR